MITTDENWLHHSIPQSKQASGEWRKRGEFEPVTAKTRLSPGKVIAADFATSVANCTLVSARLTDKKGGILMRDFERGKFGMSPQTTSLFFEIRDSSSKQHLFPYSIFLLASQFHRLCFYSISLVSFIKSKFY